MSTVTLRFFAAARAAAETDERSFTFDDAVTISAALERARTSAADYDATMGRCSFLVNAIATTDRGLLLGDGDVVDVLPPFAGG